MATNPLSYTNLTYEDILSAIRSKISSNENLANLRESAEYQTLLELIAGMTDIVNWNLEKRASENYISLAKLKSSVIGLARNIGYDITRSIPAEAKIKIRISGDLTSKGINSGDVFQIPIYTNFTYETNNFLLKKTYTYSFTDDDVQAITDDGEDFELELTLSNLEEEIYLLEGEIKDKVIEGSTNQQVGQIFQKYLIEDLTFSNQYGEQDYDILITKISVGVDENSAEEYDIDRRSVINVTSLENFILGESKKVCVLRTSNDENIELLFGDGQYASLGATVSASGPSTTFDNIYIQYLSTNGSKANQVGVINEKLTTDITITVDGADITNNVEFIFTSNIVGGADIEDIDSIRLNAPNIFYSLDRVVSKRDYVTYLKYLTSPINIKNAIAWGEQEEQRDTGNVDPIKKLFNVVLFSCLASMYNLDSSPYSVKTTENGDLDTAVLDFNYDEYGVVNQNYFNVYVKQNVVEQLQQYHTSADTYVIYGDEVDIDFTDFVTRFSTGYFYARFDSDFYLTSTYKNFASEINFSTVTTEDEIATALTNILSTRIDNRGDDVTNENYNLSAFSNIEFTWNSEYNRFEMTIPSFDPCYISEIYDAYNSTSADSLMTALGLSNKNSSKIVINDAINIVTDKINDVVDKLNTRAQLTVKNIYISPTIHNMRLTGNVYINQLADRDSTITNIKNAIYTWLDKNADFRKEIYLSNIIELIEDFDDVVYANVKFEPVDLDVNTSFVNSDTAVIVSKSTYADELSTITNLMTTPNYGNQFYNNNLTLQSFWTITKSFYDDLPATNSFHTPFRDSIDFLDLMSIVYRDNLYRIQNNLIDSNGNIINYTKGNEIVKLNLSFSGQYYSK